MFIKSIVLDGFKSYGNRVEITGFDPEFNAITGLNGTGKSNILDSICFVLGITNLSNVRAGSLQELIYKHGQAGITKATVSITFDNRDKKQCPIGYENHDEITVTRQVVMGGKNKYLINGINVQNKRVSDLFCSVQLNVNNPHFLIMQGRITKVLNMKPPEILSMVEEAAGTRMYEAKKQAAQKTIEKKDAKLRELNDIIKEDIAPKLQKLQDERSQFQEYQKVVRELENLTRLYVAWQYVKAEEQSTASTAKVTAVKDDIQQKKDKIKDNLAQAKQLDEQVNELSNKLDEESGSALQQLSAQLTSAEQAEAAAHAAASSARDALHTHERRARLTEIQLTDDEDAMRCKCKVLHQASATFESLQSAVTSSEAALAEARARFVSISAGLEGGDCSLQEQLIAAKQEASEASTAISQSTMEKQHAEQRLSALENEFQSSSGQFKQDQEKIARHEKELQKLQSAVSKLTYDPERHASLRASHRSQQAELRSQRERLHAATDRLRRTLFQYRDPETGFDRSRVHGTVCRLMKVKDPVYCTALETAAGGRLYNVVVDTAATSKLLLQRGALQARTTIIPLDKISAHVIDDHTVRVAQDIGGGADNVQLALDLTSYSPCVRSALAWVFGGTLVSRDLDTARAVTYDPRVRRRAVTWDGDVFDPAGTLSGGARAKGGSVLVQLSELQELEQSVSEMEQACASAERELTQLERTAEQYQATQQKVEMMSHELQVLKSRCAHTSHAQLHSEIETLREQVAALTARIHSERERQARAVDKARDLELKVKDIKGHRDREFKKAQASLEAAKQAHEAATAAWAARSQESSTLQLELSELQAAVTAARDQLQACAVAAVGLTEQLEGEVEAHVQAQKVVKELQASIKKQKAEIAKRSGDISRLTSQKEALLKQNNEIELQIKELDYKVKELQQEASDCAKKITSLEAEHGWIPSERQYFGLPGGVYEFPLASPAPRLQQLTSRRDKLARGLNARAHTLLGKEEEQYQDVMRKKQIVEADRAKLVQVMRELDEKKKQTLVAASQQVNRDFASIFSTLLPGAQAQLAPPPGRGVLDGLEVKVGFNSTWKESLGELSGGQRSLVALSLVLAMLLFKPAPLYILDEVDAALDLSHTQNIGIMLKEHFTASQFIIVSLKDGMFNNANVLFRTKFVDGMSSVQRTVNRR